MASEKWMWIIPVLFSGCLGLAIGMTVEAVPPTKVTIETPRTAVALEFVVERDAADKITKIHRFILWSNGDVTFPNLPYYANLRLNCRECPHPEHTCPGDIDGDGVVSVADVLAVSAAMGKKCP